jgi:hypothetical protein
MKGSEEMHFGVSMFHTDYSIPAVQLARALEERGFESMWAPEHSHIPFCRLDRVALPANASPSSDIPILLAAGDPNMDRQRYCRGRRAGDPQSRHIPRDRGADRALSQRPDCRTPDFCQFRV